MPKLSVVIPVYYNGPTLEPLYEELQEKVFSVLGCEYEIVFVDDGSGDNSFQIIRQIAEKDNNVKYVKLSRNFGSHAAILAGFAHCTGDCAVIKAADLQEPAELIVKMYESWQVGNKVVLGLREEREDSFWDKLSANVYYTLIRKFAIPDMPKGQYGRSKYCYYRSNSMVWL
jgi:dolichol-phosphate mannosyltransferase